MLLKVTGVTPLPQQEGFEGRARFRRLQAGLEQLGFRVDARNDLVRRSAHQPSRDRHALRRQRGDLGCCLHRLRFDRVGRHDAVH